MSDFDNFWLAPEDLIEINKIVGGPGAGVANLEGIRSNAERPMTDVFGHKEFPTIWDQAACLLHSIANTQYFTDGNKRTAWEACRHFLMAHGETLRPMPWMNQGSIIMNAAVNTLSIPEVAEWLYVNRLKASDRVEYAILAHDIRRDQLASAFDVYGLHITGITAEKAPTQTILSLVFRIQWKSIDVGHRRQVSVRSALKTGQMNHLQKLDSIEDRFEAYVFQESNADLYADGIPFTYSVFGLPLYVHGPGQVEFELCIDNEVAATIPLEIAVIPDPAFFSQTT